MVAIDGKTICGARSASRNTPHMVAVFDHSTGVVLGQRAVDAKSNEIPAVRDLIGGFDPADVRGGVITVDAIHTQDDTAKAIVAAGADFVFTIKANRAWLYRECKTLPWASIPIGATSTGRGNGRRARRTIKAINTPDLPGWPELAGVAHIAQLRRTLTRAGKKTVEVVYLATSSSCQDAPPAVLAAWVHGHWGIENRLHYVRDVTYAEDASHVRTGQAPRIMASLRNTAISLLPLAGWDNIAAALRHHSRNPNRALTSALNC
ncbi:ISAs1 family transposase ISBli27 [Austwickia sp. TVS 96-490-7B]|uniref:ISAs1 family transposase n=1 Tax=Austwickia sp. TVS 96-490-7B TaxID=2830843 RepID=UPI001C57E5BF|nr:ISAs1 family transposase [Austwickia sp. TVS 96-490-7B]MBW3085493.1 ISAs1 family transposase ISBli27 [Austwickia sp. TVS 96-490-7B]